MTVADLTDDQKEEIYKLFFGARLITEWSNGTGAKQFDNSLKSIASVMGVSEFIVNSYINKCIVMRRELSKPVNCEISSDEKTMTLTYKSRINYEL